MAEIYKVQPHQREYFSRLKTIQNCPPQLWVRGAMGVQSIAPDAFHLGTIGSRKTTPELFQAMDRYAHVPTTGVLFTPVNRFYPKRNLDLEKYILERTVPGNVIISEHAPLPDNVPTPKDDEAPKHRNRVITGISNAILVAGVHTTASGTRNAARQGYNKVGPSVLLQTL
jgi:predicted Rossmann fold nucleotide-binding protein DprA/Smf involved in DNA uptake